MAENIGILLVNTGTPDEPTPKAVRRYLAQFLSDPRVIEFPRWLWLPILHGIILRVRPRRSAQLYQRVWDDRGSPLLYHTQDLAEKLQGALRAEIREANVHIAAGMRYGNPSIESALDELRQKGATHLFILPLFPQYSDTTGGTIIKTVFDALKRWRWVPGMAGAGMLTGIISFTTPIRAGMLMGVWGMANMIGHALGSLIGGTIVDVVRNLLGGSAFAAYSSVFGMEVVMLLIALWISTRLDMSASKAKLESEEEMQSLPA